MRKENGNGRNVANMSGPVPTVVVDELVEFTRDLLASGMRKGEIKLAVKEVLGTDPSHRSIETLLSKAREQMRSEGNISKDEQKDESVEFYKSVLRNKRANFYMKLKARERLDNILGLENQFTSGDHTPEEKADLARSFLIKTNGDLHHA